MTRLTPLPLEAMNQDQTEAYEEILAKGGRL